MTLSCLIADTYYDRFLTDLYDQNHELTDLEYDEQHARLMTQNFGTGDAYAHGLRQLGHQAETIVLNATPLQLAWAREHHVSPARQNTKWDPDIFIAQMKLLRPDVLYIQELSIAGDDITAAVRPFTRLIVGQLACSIPPNRSFHHHDLIISSWKPIVNYFRDRGKPAEFLPLAFDPRVLDKLGPTEPAYDVSFVGGLAPVHADRIALLEHLATRTELTVFGYGAESLPRNSPILKNHKGHAWGLDACRALAASRITINSHGRIEVPGRNDGDHANNMRLFEATGVGTLLLTDWKPDLPDLFAPDRELAVYHSPAQCLENVQYYREHENDRRALAQAGQRRTLADHTYAHRLAQLAHILSRHL